MLEMHESGLYAAILGPLMWARDRIIDRYGNFVENGRIKINGTVLGPFKLLPRGTYIVLRSPDEIGEVTLRVTDESSMKEHLPDIKYIAAQHCMRFSVEERLL